MKNVKKVLILALVLCVLMCVSAFAGENPTTIASINITKGELMDPNVAGEVQFGLSYTGKDGDMYLIMVLNSELKENEAPTASDILYVNQETVEDGTATFDTVYPTEIKDSVIYLAGGDLGKLTQIGTIKANKPAYKLGDVSKDGTVDVYDATLIKRHAVGIITLSNEELVIGEVSGDGVVDVYDATLIQRYAVEIITTFPAESN